jgi:hypothetical protein
VTSNSREFGRKKTYQKPNLRVYGDVRALTQAVGTASMKGDGGGMGKGGGPSKTA